MKGLFLFEESDRLFKKFFWVFGMQPMSCVRNGFDFGIREMVRNRDFVVLANVARTLAAQKQRQLVVNAVAWQSLTDLFDFPFEHIEIETETELAFFHPIQIFHQKLPRPEIGNVLRDDVVDITSAWFFREIDSR